MKKITFSTVFLTLFLFTSQEIFSQVLWYADPDQDVRDVFRRLDPDGNRNPTGSQCVDDPNNPPTVSTPTDSNFGKYWRITKPESRKRAEFARMNGFVPQEGQTYYIGWRWRINATPNLNDGIAVFQWKTDQGGDINNNKQNYPFNMGYDGTTLTLNAYGPAEPNWNRPGSINQRKTTLWSKNVAEGSWVSIVLRIKVDRDYNSSQNRYEGFIELWFNGSKQTLGNSGFDEYTVTLSSDAKRAYHKTNDGVEVYPKWGSYNENACDYRILTDFDDMRAAKTYEEARPEPAGGNSGGNNLEGIYFLKNVATGTYLDSDGTMLKVGPNNGASDKKWRLVESASGYYNIDSEFSGRGVLDTDGNKVVKGTTIQPVSTNDDKEWSIEYAGGNKYRFKNRYQGRDYLAAITSTGEIEYTTWTGNRAQWILEPAGSSLVARIPKKTEELKDQQFQMYPNPVNDMLSLYDIEKLKTGQAIIYDVSGNKVASKKILAVDGDAQINLETLPQGVYILEIVTPEKKVQKKFVKN